MSNFSIQFTNVSFAYESTTVLTSVDFSLDLGKPLAIIGPNGGGKSTLLKLILGLESPSSGQISILGLPPQKARKQIGYMPQYIHFDPQFPVTVKEVVLMGLIHQGILGRFKKSSKEKAISALEEVGMKSALDRSFSTLSGGERQRVMIARAIVSEPKLLILDEPTNNVDPAVESQLLILLAKLQEKMDIITVSHDLAFVAAHIETVLCVNNVVHIHPVKELDQSTISELYGHHHKVVVHSRCEGGHSCPAKKENK